MALVQHAVQYEFLHFSCKRFAELSGHAVIEEDESGTAQSGENNRAIDSSSNSGRGPLADGSGKTTFLTPPSAPSPEPPPRV